MQERPLMYMLRNLKSRW